MVSQLHVSGVHHLRHKNMIKNWQTPRLTIATTAASAAPHFCRFWSMVITMVANPTIKAQVHKPGIAIALVSTGRWHSLIHGAKHLSQSRCAYGHNQHNARHRLLLCALLCAIFRDRIQKKNVAQKTQNTPLIAVPFWAVDNIFCAILSVLKPIPTWRCKHLLHRTDCCAQRIKTKKCKLPYHYLTPKLPIEASNPHSASRTPK